MSDFLTHLVDRALERGPRLDRRKASMFEPATMEPVVFDEEISIVEPPSSRQSAISGSPEQPRVRASESLAEARETALPQRPPSVHHLPETAATPSREPQVVPVPAAERIIERVETHTRDFETIVERHESRVLERHETVREAAATVIEHVEVHQPSAPPSPPRTPAPPVKADKTIAVAPPAKTITVQPVAPAVPRAEERPKVAQGERRESEKQTEPAVDAAAPTVTVTIGRVEIRSAQPPAPPQKARVAGQPQLSLEDYLKRRSGGVE